MLNDIQDEVSVVSIYQAIIYPDDDDEKFPLVLTKVKAWVLRTCTQTKLLEKVIEVTVPNA